MVNYNGGVANVTEWKISCYLEVMEGGVPCTNPHRGLRSHCLELLGTIDVLFAKWYRQQHPPANGASSVYKADESGLPRVRRLMTFMTRYTPAPDECALLKHVDGAGKVDGSAVLALPVDRWTKSEDENSFEGHGGGLTFWDGRRKTGEEREGETPQSSSSGNDGGGDGRSSSRGRRGWEPDVIKYDTRSGDLAFIDKAVWHQANPITRGTRWALVIFYEVER